MIDTIDATKPKAPTMPLTMAILRARTASLEADSALLRKIDICSFVLSNNRMNAGSSSSVRGSYEFCNISRAASPSTRFADDGPKMSSDSGSLNTPFPVLMEALPIAGITMAFVCILLSIIAVVIRRPVLALAVVILAALDVLIMIGNVIAISIWRKENLSEHNSKQ